VAQVEHAHLRAVNPVALQAGLPDVSVSVETPVEKSTGDSGRRVPILCTRLVGQSKLVTPMAVIGEAPLPSHARPLRVPPLQVPPRMPSFSTASPAQTGQGWESVIPRKMRHRSGIAGARAPVTALNVPPTPGAAATSVVRQADTPPDAQGIGGPKKNVHDPLAPPQMASLSQTMDVSATHRRL
jgi:hypothetical protein